MSFAWRRWAALMTAPIFALMAGCGSQPPSQSAAASQPSVLKPLNQTPRPMTVVRHGNHVDITMYAEETIVSIAPGVRFPAWTFDG